METANRRRNRTRDLHSMCDPSAHVHAAAHKGDNEIESEYGKDYAHHANLLKIGLIVSDHNGKPTRVWLTETEREQVLLFLFVTWKNLEAQTATMETALPIRPTHQNGFRLLWANETTQMHMGNGETCEHCENNAICEDNNEQFLCGDCALETKPCDKCEIHVHALSAQYDDNSPYLCCDCYGASLAAK